MEIARLNCLRHVVTMTSFFDRLIEANDSILERVVQNLTLTFPDCFGTPVILGS